MSKEEIIEIIEELQCEYKEQENENKYNNYTVYKAKRYSKGLQGLLDLYNKEKEKNEKLSNTNKKLYDLAHRQAMQQFIENDYISKDKIKEKIEKYQELDKKEFAKQGNFKCEISVLQELLEEE